MSRASPTIQLVPKILQRTSRWATVVSSILFAVVLALTAELAFSQDVGPSELSVRRYLHAVRYAEGFRGGVRIEKERAGRSTRSMEFILNASDATLEAIVARAYVKRLTESEAQTLAEFYESPTGSFVTDFQKRLPHLPRTTMYLPPEHEGPYRRFRDSRLESKIEAISTDRALWDDISLEIQRAVNK